ncbi:DUF485 domain-containing protein [Streptomyces sp. NPDC059785]|uniref:DUF485 domain-containing protein n=1 Tax=Streptomyces sp. NPDC059785 TaxID=3346945 RepID=UPI003659745F
MPDAFSSPDHRPPRPHHHDTSPAHATYPWQPPPPEPPGPRLPHRRPLGRHSDLRVLRGAYRRQRRVAAFTALGYFTAFLLLSAFAPSVMTRRVPGGLPAGLLLGLLQIPVTCLAIWLYEYTARRRVDPLADRIRRQAELHAERRRRAGDPGRDPDR